MTSQKTIHNINMTTDLFSRSITYLRLSLTDHCNLRCQYCSPGTDKKKLANTDLLSYEELIRIVTIAVQMGIKKVRLTGGELMVRRNIISFIRQLGKIEGLNDIRITTNGTLLAPHLEELQAAGVKKLNISLDTLKPEKFQQITGANLFSKVWESIQKAKTLGFSPIKINIVAMKDVNDDEIMDFGRLSQKEPFQIRFIEFMPMGKDTIWNKDRYISTESIKKILSQIGELSRVSSEKSAGPARIFRFAGAKGSLGFISPISNHFCEKCNRLRITSNGKLRSCLLTDKETNLKKIIRSNCSDNDIKQALIKTILQKPKGHTMVEKEIENCHGQMSRIGG
jgi:GTP 3',8-cyclase